MTKFQFVHSLSWYLWNVILFGFCFFFLRPSEVKIACWDITCWDPCSQCQHIQKYVVVHAWCYYYKGSWEKNIDLIIQTDHLLETNSKRVILETVSIFFIFCRQSIYLIFWTASFPKLSWILSIIPVCSSSLVDMFTLALAYNSSKVLRDICKAEYSSALPIKSSKPRLSCSSTPSLTISLPCLAMFSKRSMRIMKIWWAPLTWNIADSSKLSKLRTVFFEKGSLTWLFCLVISANRDSRKSIFCCSPSLSLIFL